jgi:hypothetical protein
MLMANVLRCSTSVYEGSGFVDELIDFGSGVYLKDTVSLQGVATKHMYFGYLTSYGDPSGLLVPAATIAGMSCHVASPVTRTLR